MSKRTQIVYLGGWGRSGSTLISRVLGEIDGWCAIGEARSAWDHGVLRNRPCGCGAPFHECQFWSAVFREAFGGMDRDLASRMVAGSDDVRTWHMNVLPTAVLRRFARGRLSEYVTVLNRLYRAAAEVAGARVLVDSSKLPPYAYALSLMPDHELRVGHLVRDPRACTYSWWKRRKNQPFGRMKSVGPFKNSLQWVNRNRAIEKTWSGSPMSYRLIRYEDFVADPHAFIKAIARFAGEDAPDLSHIEGATVRIGPAHMAAGNPNRFETGRIELRLDSEWQQGLPSRDQAVVAFLSGAWMRQYGYT